ncbi:LacI family DNA-binding transcriptional regulator [Bifidobacterium sp. SMB2]|nr:LacI family DNA-binding transcriptional regulator [Bifidobacterium sp. SMB2]
MASWLQMMFLPPSSGSPRRRRSGSPHPLLRFYVSRLYKANFEGTPRKRTIEWESNIHSTHDDRESFMADSIGKKNLRVTQIAEIAGVSASTVSKVINRRSDVSDETRQRIETILEDIGYERKDVGNRRVAHVIDVVISHIDSSGTLELIRGASRYADDLGVDVVMHETKPKGRYELFRRIMERNPLGVILMLTDMTDEERQLFSDNGIPYVVFDLPKGAGDEYLSVGVDNWTGGLMAGRYLTDMGHRRIGVVTGPNDSEASCARLEGFKMALRAANIEVNDDLIRECDYMPKTAHHAALEMLSLDEPPTAIFALNDLMAVGVYQAASKCHIIIPDQLSVVGFDDVFPSRFLGPALTTVRQPFDIMMCKAMDLVYGYRDVNYESVPRDRQRRVILSPELIVRDSVAALSQ